MISKEVFIMKSLIMSVLLVCCVSSQALQRLPYRVLNHQCVGYIPVLGLTFNGTNIANESIFTATFLTRHESGFGCVIAIDSKSKKELMKAIKWLKTHDRGLCLAVTYVSYIESKGQKVPVYKFNKVYYHRPHDENGDYIVDDTLITPSPSDYKPIRK